MNQAGTEAVTKRRAAEPTAPYYPPGPHSSNHSNNHSSNYSSSNNHSSSIHNSSSSSSSKEGVRSMPLLTCLLCLCWEVVASLVHHLRGMGGLLARQHRGQQELLLRVTPQVPLTHLLSKRCVAA